MSKLPDIEDLLVTNVSNLDSLGNSLMCPHCKEEYLHHDSVEVFFRTEDAEKGMHVRVHAETHIPRGVVVDEDLNRNPSYRRDGILIHFYCEMGCRRSSLAIVQHKGSTYLSFV